MDLATLWRPSVVAYLSAPGRDVVAGMDLARAVGRNYLQMDVAGWRLLAKLALDAGWRKAKRDGVAVWVSPAARIA